MDILKDFFHYHARLRIHHDFRLKFFNPKSVAVIGATEDPGNITSVVITNLIEMGFKGRLVPVNPHHDEVFGLKCYTYSSRYPSLMSRSR